MRAVSAEEVEIDVIGVPDAAEVVAQVGPSFEDEPVVAVSSQDLQKEQVEYFNVLRVRTSSHVFNDTDNCLWCQ
jgi:hypothetical protein